jgi:hypothetical protein
MMARCPSCEYPLPDDRERLGARCPSCRDPLYEPAGRSGRPAREEEGSCVIHAGIETVGVCARCGNYLCEVCRTRWRGTILCAACVDRALESSEATPEQIRSHFRQAILSLILGIAAWVLSFLGFLMIALLVGGDGDPGMVAFVFLGLLVLAGSVLVAALGIGQATAALRTRGNHMILATIGLILSGLFIGALFGFATFNMWQST